VFYHALLRLSPINSILIRSRRSGALQHLPETVNNVTNISLGIDTSPHHNIKRQQPRHHRRRHHATSLTPVRYRHISHATDRLHAQAHVTQYVVCHIRYFSRYLIRHVITPPRFTLNGHIYFLRCHTPPPHCRRFHDYAFFFTYATH